MSKFIEIIGIPYDEGYHRDMKKNGVIKQNNHIVNINEISNISHWKGKLLLEGKEGSEITMTNGKKLIDYRLPNEFKKQLNVLKYTADDVMNFGLFLSDNLKNAKGKKIDDLFEEFIK